MEAADFLMLCAEVFVALAGFAGIIAKFQFRDDRKIRRADLVGLNIIVLTTLLNTLGCIVPLALLTYEIKEATVWGWCSGAFAVPAAMLVYSSHSGLRGKIRRKSIVVYHGLLEVMMGVTIIGLVLNALDVIFHREPGPYILSLVAGMVVSGLMFAQLLLMPLWRRLRKQESSDAAVTNTDCMSLPDTQQTLETVESRFCSCLFRPNLRH